MDRARDRLPSVATGPEDGETGGSVDLHLHSTASDGALAPEHLVERAVAAGLRAIALTDHDTVAGIPPGLAAGQRLGLRVISGCEFSVAAPWGEMHVLGYFLPPDSPVLEAFLQRRRADRERRARAMVICLQANAVAIKLEDVSNEAGGAAVGRPHVARALVGRGAVGSVNEAFDRYLARGRPCFVEKTLPAFAEVADLVHRVGGIVSAAHLKDRGTLSVLRRLQEEGLDAVETRHPSHDPDTRAWLTKHALELGLLRSGGSDWHGDPTSGADFAPIGSQSVPAAWLDELARKAAHPTLSEVR